MSSTHSTESTRTLHVGHSPDADDAFMFFGLSHERFDTGNLRFTHELVDIETLNQRAMRGELEISAVSIHAFAYLTDRYALLASGSSMGDRYGPKIVTRDPVSLDQLRSDGTTIAIPGRLTTAYLSLQLCLGKDVSVIDMPFDQILPAVAEGKVDAGVLIHEGQLYYRDRGLHQVVDLGEWWYQETELPLPLGGNVVRKDLGQDVVDRVATYLRQSIQYGLDHREESLAYALSFARDLDPKLADQFVGMYVNDWTVDYGPVGRQAVQTLLDRGHQAGILPEPVNVQFVG